MAFPNFINGVTTAGATLSSSVVGNAVVLSYTFGAGNCALILIYLTENITINNVLDNLGNAYSLSSQVFNATWGTLAVAGVVSNNLPGKTVSISINCATTPTEQGVCQLCEYGSAGKILATLGPTSQSSGTSFSQAISGAGSGGIVFSAIWYGQTISAGTNFNLRTNSTGTLAATEDMPTPIGTVNMLWTENVADTPLIAGILVGPPPLNRLILV